MRRADRQRRCQVAPAFGQVEAAIRQVREQIRDLNASSIRTLEMVGMNDRQKYGYIDKEIAADLEAPRSATDPAQVSKLFGEINAGVMEAFNLIPESMQKGMSGQFIDILKEADALANERLQVRGTAQEPRDVSIAVAEGLAGPASTMQGAGQAMLTAAERIAAAVGGMPDRFVIENRVSVVMPEVGRGVSYT